MSEIPRISPTEGFVTREPEDIIASMFEQFQNGSAPISENLTYEGVLIVSLLNIPALELSLIQGFQDGNYIEFEIGTVSDPKDVYLDTQNSQLVWQSGATPDINSTYKIWYRYQVDPSTMRSETPGSLVRLTIESMGYEFRHAYQFMREIYDSGIVDTATGLSLDFLATITLGTPYVYPDGTPTPRQQPHQSIGDVTFFGDEGGQVSSNTIVTTNEAQPRRFQMTNPQVQTIPVGSDSITISFTSVEEGAIENAATGLISVIEDPGTVSNITSASNLASFQEGSDLESDESLRDRAKNAFQTAGRGTLGAIKYSVLAIPGIADCITNDQTTIRSIEKGFVSVMVIGETIPIDKTSTLWNTIIGTVDAYKGAGIVPQISQPYLKNISMNTSLKASVNYNQIQNSVLSTIQNYINSLSAGQDVLYYQILRSIRNIENIEDFIINFFQFSDASNFGQGGSSSIDPTPDFSKQWWNSGIDNTNQQNTQPITISDTEFFAQVFTPTNEWLSGVSVFRKNDSSGSGGNRIIEIWEVATGNDEPQQKIAGSSTYAQIIVPESAWEDASDFDDNSRSLKFPEPVRLDTSKNYAIVIYKIGSTDDTSLMDATDTANPTWASADTGGTWGAPTDINTHDLMYVLHFSGEYKVTQSFTFRTKVVRFEKRKINDITVDTITFDPVSDTKVPCNQTGFLGIWGAVDLTGDGEAESPDLFNLENYGLRGTASIAIDGEIVFDKLSGETFQVDQEFVVSYEYYPELEGLKGVKIWLREEGLYEENFDGKVILRIETNNVDEPSGELVCFNQIGYCLIYDASETGNEWHEETRDINDSDAGDVKIEVDTGDFLYIGHQFPFKSIFFDIQTVPQTAGLIVVEYWNGSTWEQFEQFNDDTISGGVSLEQDGLITFSPPNNWATSTVKDISAYWVRIDTSALDDNPTITLAYLSFAEKALTSSELDLSTSFTKEFFEFDTFIRMLDSAVSGRYWIVLQAVGQRTGRIILKTDNAANNYPGESKIFDGTDWTSENHEELTLVTEESATTDGADETKLVVANQANLVPASDAKVIDIMLQSNNNKGTGARSYFHDADDGDGTFSISQITILAGAGTSTDVYVTYAYDFNLNSSIHTDWMFEVIIEKLIDPASSSRIIDPNIPIEDQQALLEKAQIGEITITRIE